MLRQDGTAVSKAEEEWKDYAQVIDIAYRICQSGELEKTESADTEQYTIHLDRYDEGDRGASGAGQRQT